MTYWTVEPTWRGLPAVILGSGPSLCHAQLERVRAARQADRIRVIAINNGYECAPWADILYFCDIKWWTWHRARAGYRSFAGEKVTLENLELQQAEPTLRCLRNYTRPASAVGQGLCTHPDGVHTGWNSGYQAINLAVHKAAALQILLGFDMKAAPGGRLHWHPDHPVVDGPGVFADKMLPCFTALATDLAHAGVRVLNATPGSALTVFPMVELDQVLDIKHAA